MFLVIKLIYYQKVNAYEECIQTNENFVSDSESYLSDVRKCLENKCTKRDLGKHIVKYYDLISARTGYGIEELISKVFRYWSPHTVILDFISLFCLISMYVCM